MSANFKNLVLIELLATQPFRTLTSIAVPLDRTNVDTDQIIPKQFLKRIERSGYGEFLFYDWRRIQEGPEEGELKAKLKILPKLVQRGLSVQEIAELLELDDETIRKALGE